MAGLIEGLGPTVLILGAGASRPYGYPIGSELRRSLEAAHIERDGFLSSLGHTDNEAYRRTFRVFQSTSIDEFLGTYPEHSERAKLEIAYHLIKQENPFLLTSQEHSDHWYQYLYKEVLGVGPQLGNGKLSIITFNYDLSLETYLCETNAIRHKLSADEARERMQRLPIVHVHGHIGAIDVVHGKGRAYGTISADLLKEAASRMAIIHEEQTAKFWERAHALLDGASNVLFLGFGYVEQNLERLALGTHCKNARVFLAPMNCPGAHKFVEKHALGVKITTCRDVPSEIPALARAQWLFETAGKPPPGPKRIRSPGFGGPSSWMRT